MVSRIVFLDTDKDWTKHGWMSMGLTLLLQQHMPSKYSNGPKLKVESNSKTQTSPLFVQNQQGHPVSSERPTPSLKRELHSVFKQMLQVHNNLHFPLHITIIEYNWLESTLDCDLHLMLCTFN